MKRFAAALKPRDRRAIIIGLAAVLLVLLVRVAPALARSLQSLEAHADAARLELARAHELLDSQPLLRDSLAGRGARLVALAPRLVAGRTAAEAGAELASAVTAAAARHRVRITRQEPRPDSAASLFVRVALRLEAEGDISGVAGWIAELEEGRQLLTIPELSIQAAEPAAPPQQVERLRVELTVAGWSAPRTRGSQ